MSDEYWIGLNRYLPAAVTNDSLVVPSLRLTGKFDRVENTRRFTRRELFTTPPIAKLVAPRRELPWNAPTVVLRPQAEGSRTVKLNELTRYSDYRYIQTSNRRRFVLPVLHYDTGLIYDIAPKLKAIDLLDYSRLLAAAAEVSLKDGRTDAVYARHQ